MKRASRNSAAKTFIPDFGSETLVRHTSEPNRNERGKRAVFTLIELLAVPARFRSDSAESIKV